MAIELLTESKKKPTLTYTSSGISLKVGNLEGDDTLYVNRTQYDKLIRFETALQVKREVLAAESHKHFKIFDLDGDIYEPIELTLLCYRHGIMPSIFALHLLSLKADWEYQRDQPQHKKFLSLTSGVTLYTQHLTLKGFWG